LLTGTFSDFSLARDLSGNVKGLGSAVGWARETPLLNLLGFDADLDFTFIGISMTTTALAQGGAAGQAVSTDIMSTAVPEPSSLLLLATGLFGAFGAVRRRINL
jgi:hypothetical protein